MGNKKCAARKAGKALSLPFLTPLKSAFYGTGSKISGDLGRPMGRDYADNRFYAEIGELVNAALPRIRDFHGVPPNSFDGQGNYSLGIKEQIIFPEIDYDKIDKIRGMNIAITTTARTDEEARELLAEFGMPFRK